jgi:hypothetical protein
MQDLPSRLSEVALSVSREWERVFCPTYVSAFVQGSMGWSEVWGSEPRIHESGLLAVWTSAQALALRPSLYLPLLWGGVRPRPQRDGESSRLNLCSEYQHDALTRRIHLIGIAAGMFDPRN